MSSGAESKRRHENDNEHMKKYIADSKLQGDDYVFYECRKCKEDWFEYPKAAFCKHCLKYLCLTCYLDTFCSDIST